MSPSGQIKFDKAAFSAAQSQQQVAINNMKSLANTQQAFLNTMANAWKGVGGARFRDDIMKIATDTNMGIFMLQTLNNQTRGAHAVMEAADKNILSASSNNHYTR